MDAAKIVSLWASHSLRNIRFSGGEPTLWKDLLSLVAFTRSYGNFKHIALSTNGSASLEFYKQLVEVGVNDFSISLDACCAMSADMMAGTNSHFEHITNVIRDLSELTYVTVGIVLDQRNNNVIDDIIMYAANLGVSDIRIIPSAQSNHGLAPNVAPKVMNEHRILSYRIHNINNGRHVRGIQSADSHKCHLVKDDMVVMKDYHFPCVIYMREKGEPIGCIGSKTMKEIRAERKAWFESHDTHNCDICKRNCLDVCIDHNNKVEELNPNA